MKKYEAPISEIIELEPADVITTSPDTPYIDGDDLIEDEQGGKSLISS